MAVLALLLVTLFFIGLGDRPYSVPSESRYVEIGREMAESGDYVTPRLDYVKYFEKPPLFYWIQAATTKYLGLDPFVARIPTALFAVLLCLLTYALGYILYGSLAGWLSTGVLATTLYMFALSRVVLVDVPVSVFLVATLTLFLYGAYAPHGKKRMAAIYAMYVAAAFAVLTKGLIGVVLPGAIVFIWLLLIGKWKILTQMRLINGTLLLLLIAVPWHILVSLRNPEFPYFYFVHEHIERYLTTTHGRYQPDWFFAVVLAAGLFPWLSFAVQSVHSGLRGFWETRRRDGRQLFLVIWIAFIFVFFSFSDSKLIPYILPIFPPIAVLIGRYLADAWREKPAEFFKTGLFVNVVLLITMAVAPILLPQIFDADSKVMEAVGKAKDEIRYLSILSIISMGGLLVTYIQGQRRHLIILLIIVATLIVQMGDGVAVHYDRDSTFSIASTVASMLKPGDEVVSYDEYYQDLPVYLKRKISLVSWKKTELEFGAWHEATQSWMFDEDDFWKRWLKGDKNMFAVMHYETYQQIIKDKKPEDLHLYLLAGQGRNVLFMNHMPEAKK